jgi:hypothetical protein
MCIRLDTDTCIVRAGNDGNWSLKTAVDGMQHHDTQLGLVLGVGRSCFDLVFSNKNTFKLPSLGVSVYGSGLYVILVANSYCSEPCLCIGLRHKQIHRFL